MAWAEAGGSNVKQFPFPYDAINIPIGPMTGTDLDACLKQAGSGSQSLWLGVTEARSGARS
jgi:hypothetical protein